MLFYKFLLLKDLIIMHIFSIFSLFTYIQSDTESTKEPIL